MTGGGLHHLLLTISVHACSGTSNVGRILMAKSHPNHNTTHSVSTQPRLQQRAREIQAYSSVRHMLPLELEEPVRLEMTVQLNQLLADTMTLRDLYKKSHWQVAGPTFFQLHLLYDKHHDARVELLDSIAERIQLLGGASLAMAPDIAEARLSGLRAVGKKFRFSSRA